jgi:hypothetical protein
LISLINRRLKYVDILSAARLLTITIGARNLIRR